MHDRPRLTRRASAVVVALAVVAAGVVLVVRLNRPVQVAPPVGAADPGCARLADSLPTQVLKQSRVATSSHSPAVAAWGDPAIIWRCGVDPPGPTTEECIEVNGVDWVLKQLDDGASFTTYGRDPAVQVLVPHDYAPETFALPAFAPVVAQVPQGEHRCS